MSSFSILYSFDYELTIKFYEYFYLLLHKFYFFMKEKTKGKVYNIYQKYKLTFIYMETKINCHILLSVTVDTSFFISIRSPFFVKIGLLFTSPEIISNTIKTTTFLDIFSHSIQLYYTLYNMLYITLSKYHLFSIYY